MQIRISRGGHRWSRNLVTPYAVCLCRTSLGPSTSQGNNQDCPVHHDKQWQKPSRQGKTLFRWGCQNRFATYIDKILHNLLFRFAFGQLLADEFPPLLSLATGTVQ